MSKLSWTPWHDAVRLRDDVRSGDFSLALFAADLYDVVMGRARPVYQDPREFFALTYPTYNLRELAKDVVVRLAGKNDKAVRQLELTYGGGKTHTLITLYHLTHAPDKLPDAPAVKEFTGHIGFAPPKTRVAVLAFDKLDAEKGAEIPAPNGDKRWLKHPWSVLAYQLAGGDGLRLLHAEDQEAERESPPAENLLVDLLAWPAKHGMSTLVLIDEVLTFARTKVDKDPAWHDRLANFFQYLTQAATKVDRCAIVASLLATDPRKSDTLGKSITRDLYAVFHRQREEGVQPVLKEDVAEILRRRLFTAESIANPKSFAPRVSAALQGIAALDEQTRKDGGAAEERFLKSYPFHPDLTEVFYSKWTQLEGFQRTRGVLRTFALALRAAEQWDQSPLISAGVFLPAPGQPGISEAARELTTTATTEEYEGKRQEWTGILEGELAKAREIQAESPSLKFRELEAAVFAIFLHSQPATHKALTRELMLLVGATRPDRIELEKALRRWSEVSWFLDEEPLHEVEVGPDGGRQLPKSWRLGSKPNLRQMHHDACSRVQPEGIEGYLRDAIGRLKGLTEGAELPRSGVHTLPAKPDEVEDDAQFHYCVLGPRAASSAGAPSEYASRFITETTSKDRPRVYGNAIVLAVPSPDGIEVARNCVRDYLAWEEVGSQLKSQHIDAARQKMLDDYTEAARRRIPDAIRHAYCIIVTLSARNEVEAFKITVGPDPLFKTILADKRSRIQKDAINAAALLPGGPYDLWRESEPAHRVKDLVTAFAQFARLPKMLNRDAVLATLVAGCVDGALVLRFTRPDRSAKTFWRQAPDDQALKDQSLEALLPTAAALADLAPALLSPGALPGLWQAPELALNDLYDYFSGGRVVSDDRAGYAEPMAVPRADREVVDAAVRAAVKDGILWLTNGPATICAEEVPAGLLAGDARLQAPPAPVSLKDILPPSLAAAWSESRTSALTIATALSMKAGKALPWVTIRQAIDGALRARLLERAAGSAPWPCDYAGAQTVILQLPSEPPPPPPPLRALVAEAELQTGEIQDLADHVDEVFKIKAAAGLNLTLRLRIELAQTPPPSEDAISQLNDLLRKVSPKLTLRAGDPE